MYVEDSCVGNCNYMKVVVSVYVTLNTAGEGREGEIIC